MNRTLGEKFQRQLLKFFIKRPLTPSFLQLFFLGFEMLFFVWLVTMKNITNFTISINAFQIIIPIGLGITILLRFFTTYLLIRPIYIPFIVIMCLMNLSAIQFICGIIIGIMILVQILSSIECDFETNNVDSETFNINKFFHYGFMVFAAILQFIPLPIPLQPIIKNGVCMTMLIVVFVMKALSKLRNMQTKNIYLRFYLLCFFYFKIGIIVQFISIPTIALHAYAVIVSQLIYTLAECYFRGIPIEQHLSKDQHSLLAFILLSYLYSNHYDKNIEQGIEKFLSTQNSNQKQMQIKNSMIESIFMKKTAGDLIRKVAHRLLMLINSSSPDDLLIKIEICLHIFGKVIMAKNMIEKGKSKISGFNFIQKIHYYRMQQKMKRVIRSQYQLMNSEEQYFDSFLQNEHFAYQLVRGCHAYIQLLQYLCTTELIYEKLQKSIKRVLKQNYKTLHNHSKSNPLCLKLFGFYLDYLYLVERDVQRAKNLLEKTMFNIDYEISLKTDSKIFIKLKLDSENFFQIADIGCNVKTLIGHSRKDIKGMRHTVLLPEFYADTHQSLVQQLFLDRTAYTYCKFSLIKHAQGHYLPCFVDLRLRYLFGLGNQGQIQMVGYFQMLEEEDVIQKYNWLNFFFVRTDNGQIIEYSSNVSQLKHEYKKINMISDLLDLQLTEINFNQPYNIVRGQSTIEMVPYKRFKTKNIEVVMYVQMLSKKVLEYGQKTPILKSYSYQSNLQFLKKSLKKYELKNNSLDAVDKNQEQKGNIQNYLVKKAQLLSIIYSKMELILILIFFFLVLAILGIQIYTFQAIFEDSQNRNNAITSGYQLIRHQMSLSTLMIMGSNQYFKSNFNYTNDQYQYSYFEYGSELERTNNLFKEYAKNSYMFFANDVEYPVTTSQLISGLYAYLFTNMYLQLPVLQTTSMNYLFENIRILLIDSYNEYQKRVIEQLQSHDMLFLGIQTGVTVLIFLIAIASFILLLVIQRRKRSCQFETFTLISGLSNQNTWMNNIKQCLRRITNEQNYQTSMEESMKNWSNFNENEKIFEEANKGDISARQDSMRNLILSSNHSSRNRFQQTDSQIMSNQQSNSIINSHQIIDGSFAKDPVKMNRRSIRVEKSALKNQDKGQKIELKIKSVSKAIVIISFIFFFLTCSIHLSKYIFDNYIKKFNEVDSVKNLLYLSHKELRFSNTVVAFMGELSHSEQRVKTFEKNLEQYYSADQKIVFFQESTYPEFNQFSQALRNFRYKYLCDYAECKPAYASQINIIFSTTVQKLIYYMQQTLNSTDKTTLKTYLEQDKVKNNDFGILLYTQRLLQKVIMDLVDLYIVNFKIFESWDTMIQVVLIGINIGIISLGILIVLMFFYLIWSHKKYQVEMLNLIKQSSYHFEIENKKQSKIDSVIQEKRPKQNTK